MMIHKPSLQSTIGCVVFNEEANTEETSLHRPLPYTGTIVDHKINWMNSVCKQGSKLHHATRHLTHWCPAATSLQVDSRSFHHRWSDAGCVRPCRSTRRQSGTRVVAGVPRWPPECPTPVSWSLASVQACTSRSDTYHISVASQRSQATLH